ncbi:membrane protein [Gordonia phage Pherobrine]|nr:membrane protein [Gordonia phage Pherobrine]
MTQLGRALATPWYYFKPWTRHGLILTTAGLVYIAMGIMFMAQPPSDTREENLKLALNILPYKGWAVVFIIVGCVTFVSARWPAAPKSLGYSVLTGLSAAWSGFHILGGSIADNAVYIASGFSWALVAFMWWAVSGLVAPPKEREIGGYPNSIGHLAGCTNCGSVCVCNTETGLEGKPPSTDGYPSEHDGSGSVRPGESIRRGDDYSPE